MTNNIIRKRDGIITYSKKPVVKPRKQKKLKTISGIPLEKVNNKE